MQHAQLRNYYIKNEMVDASYILDSILSNLQR